MNNFRSFIIGFLLILSLYPGMYLIDTPGGEMNPIQGTTLNSDIKLDQTTNDSKNNLSILLQNIEYLQKRDGTISRQFASSSDTEAMLTLLENFPNNYSTIQTQFQNYIQPYYSEQSTFLFYPYPRKNVTSNKLINSTIQLDNHNSYDKLAIWLSLGNEIPDSHIDEIKTQIMNLFNEEIGTFLYDLQTAAKIANLGGFSSELRTTSTIDFLKQYVIRDSTSSLYGGISSRPGYTDISYVNMANVPYMLSILNLLGIDPEKVITIEVLKQFTINSLTDDFDDTEVHNPLGLNYSSMFKSNPVYKSSHPINHYIQGRSEPILDTIGGIYTVEFLQDYTTIGLETSDSIDLILNQAKTTYWKDQDSNGIIDHDPYFSLFPYQHSHNLFKSLGLLLQQVNIPELTYENLINATSYAQFLKGGYSFGHTSIQPITELIRSVGNSAYKLDIVFGDKQLQNYIKLLEDSIIRNITRIVSYQGKSMILNISGFHENIYRGIHQQQSKFNKIGLHDLSTYINVPVLENMALINDTGLFTPEFTERLADLIVYKLATDDFYFDNSFEKLKIEVLLSTISDKYPLPMSKTSIMTYLTRRQSLSGGLKNLYWLDTMMRDANSLLHYNSDVFDPSVLAEYLVQTKVENNDKQGWDQALAPDNTSISVETTTAVIKFLSNAGLINQLFTNNKLNQTAILNVYLDNLASTDEILENIEDIYNRFMPFQYLGYSLADLNTIIPDFPLEEQISYVVNLQITPENFDEASFYGSFGRVKYSNFVASNLEEAKRYTQMAGHLLQYFNAIDQINKTSITEFVESQRITQPDQDYYGFFQERVGSIAVRSFDAIEIAAIYYDIIESFELNVNDYNLQSKVLEKLEGNKLYNSRYLIQTGNILGHGEITTDLLEVDKVTNSFLNILTINHLPERQMPNTRNTLDGIRIVELLGLGSSNFIDRGLDFLASMQITDYYRFNGGFTYSPIEYWADPSTSINIMNTLSKHNATDRIDISSFARFVYNKVTEIRYSTGYYYYVDEILPIFGLVSYIENMEFFASQQDYQPIIRDIISNEDAKNGLSLQFKVTDVFGNINSSRNYSIFVDGQLQGQATFSSVQVDSSVYEYVYEYHISSSVFGSIGDLHLIEIKSKNNQDLQYAKNVTVVDNYLSYKLNYLTETIKRGQRFKAIGILTDGLNRSVKDLSFSSNLEGPVFNTPQYGVDYRVSGKYVTIEVNFYNYPATGDYELDITFYEQIYNDNFSVKFKFEILENTDITTTTTTSSTSPIDNGGGGDDNRLTGPEDPPLAISGFGISIIMTGILVFTVLRRQKSINQ